MSDIGFYIPYWGPFLIEAEVSQEFVDLLLEKGNESREKNLDYTKNLAGDIDNEYYYHDFQKWFTPLMNPYVQAYFDGVTTYRTAKATDAIDGWDCVDMWINYQKAKEYNPPHNHNADLSFVIYLDVPEEIKQEHLLTEGVAAQAGPGMIVFDYGIDLPFSNCRHCILPKKGDIIVFPAWLPHHVYAFKSDVERISVSGNISLQTELNMI
tara:strand:+ start:24 stop:653 length:630 start_codon:yes stop_codon:yes gene_type:complete